MGKGSPRRLEGQSDGAAPWTISLYVAGVRRCAAIQSRGGGGRLVVQIPDLNCLKFRQCGAKEIYRILCCGAKSDWFARFAGRNAPGVLADKWYHLIDKDSLKINALEHVLIENVEQLFLVSCYWRIFCWGV